MIRRATEEDAAAVGKIYLRARDEMAYLPRFPDSDRDSVGRWIVGDNEVWVAEVQNGVVGFAALEIGWLNHIYVDPARQGHGIGNDLLDHAKALQPRGLQLWVFQQNEGARRLYERNGFGWSRRPTARAMPNGSPMPATNGCLTPQAPLAHDRRSRPPPSADAPAASGNDCFCP